MPQTLHKPRKQTAIFAASAKVATPIELVRSGDYKTWLKRQSASAQGWLQSVWQVPPKPGAHALLPASDGSIKRVVTITGDLPGLWDIAALPLALPVAAYRLLSHPEIDAESLFRLCLGWGYGAYQFTRYKQAKRLPATLVMPQGIDTGLLDAMVVAQTLGRDLINTPAEDLGPPELAAAALDLAQRHGTSGRVVKGEALLRENFPLIHAVGRAANKPPQLIDFSWGDPSHPKVTLVGKGVCFDTGGLDLKNSAGMYNMKKDMGGAASVLAAAHMIMASRLPVRLRVIIAAVENAIGPNAMRPRDIVRARTGVTVEIANTDAEGRLILADALALAAEEKPAVLVDMATLTGSKMAVFGLEIGVIMSNSDGACAQLATSAAEMNDPLWRVPVYPDYDYRLDSGIADTLSCSEGQHADPILAALFLQRFAVPGGAPEKRRSPTEWVHFDILCMNMRNRAGRPEGGEAQGARALFWWLRQRYAAA